MMHAGTALEMEHHSSHHALQAERAVSWRVLPVLLMVVMVSFIDRTNLSFASITMNRDLGFSSTTYGLAAGMFSIGYALGQVPSNIMLMRLGAPIWLAVLCFAWGLTAGAFAFVSSAATFVGLRLLLGFCEAGSIPGVWAVVGQLYPPDRTTLPLVVIETGITASQVLGSPIAAGLLAMDGAWSLAGWQWVFLAEAAPALLLSCILAATLPSSIQAASFLTPQQRAALEHALLTQQATSGPAHAFTTSPISTTAVIPSKRRSDAGSAAHHPDSNRATGLRSEGGLALPLSTQWLPRLRSAGFEPPHSPTTMLPSSSRGGGGGLRVDSASGGSTLAVQHQTVPATAVERHDSSSGGGSAEEDQQLLLCSAWDDGMVASSSCYSPRHGARPGSGSGGVVGRGRRRQGEPGGLRGETAQQLEGVGRQRGGQRPGSPGVKGQQLGWRGMMAAARSPIVLYAGAWRILHDIGGTGLMFFTPLIIYSLTGNQSPPEGALRHQARWEQPLQQGSSGGAAQRAGGSTPAAVAMWSSIPYLVTSLVHVANGWHSQATKERRLHLGLCWALGSGALLALTLTMGQGAHPAASFMLLVLAHVGLNGANGVQTSWIASFLEGHGKTVGLAAYNTLGQMGGFLGPYAVGALHQRSGGYGAAMGLMGVCLAAATAMVLLLSESWARGGPWRRQLQAPGSRTTDAAARGSEEDRPAAAAEAGCLDGTSVDLETGALLGHAEVAEERLLHQGG